MILQMQPMRRAGGEKTYTDWVAHLAARTSEVVGWSGPLNSTFGNNSYRTQAASGGFGNMYGSPWGSTQRVEQGGYTFRIVRHGMASEADFDSQVSASSAIIITTKNYGGYAGFFGIDRNGYPSLDDGTAQGFQVSEVSYWDHATGKPLTTDPSTSSGPVPYVHAGW